VNKITDGEIDNFIAVFVAFSAAIRDLDASVRRLRERMEKPEFMQAVQEWDDASISDELDFWPGE